MKSQEKSRGESILRDREEKEEILRTLRAAMQRVKPRPPTEGKK